MKKKKGGKFTPRSDWLENVPFSADICLETRRANEKRLWACFLQNRSIWSGCAFAHEGSCTRFVQRRSLTLAF